MDFKDLQSKISSIKFEDLIDAVKEWEAKTWIYIVLGVVGFLLFFFFLFQPAWFQRPQLKKQSLEIETQMIRLKALSHKKPELEKQKKEIQELVDDFQKRLFPEDQTPFLLGKISKIAQDAQVELVSSKPLDNVQAFPDPYGQKYKKYAYQIAVEGSYHRIASFVSYLESYAQYFQVQDLRISSQADKLGKLIADIELMAVSHNTVPQEKEPAHAPAK